MDAKLKALAEHRSQVEGNMLGFFVQWLPAEAEENGRKIGVHHAEGFRLLQLEYRVGGSGRSVGGSKALLLFCSRMPPSA